jgi:uncharacterized Zn finger protein
MTLGEFFQDAINIEKIAAGIYQDLAEAFAHKKDISFFWRGLREDELMHAKMLEKSRLTLDEKDLESLVDQSMLSKIQEVNKFLKENPLNQIQDLEDAYDLAHELEFSEVNVIFKFLTFDQVPWIYQEDLIENMLQIHQQKLIHFDEAFGDKKWRKTVKANIR